jgi:hypothetical protein
MGASLWQAPKVPEGFLSGAAAALHWHGSQKVSDRRFRRRSHSDFAEKQPLLASSVLGSECRLRTYLQHTPNSAPALRNPAGARPSALPKLNAAENGSCGGRGFSRFHLPSQKPRPLSHKPRKKDRAPYLQFIYKNVIWLRLSAVRRNRGVLLAVQCAPPVSVLPRPLRNAPSASGPWPLRPL